MLLTLSVRGWRCITSASAVQNTPLVDTIQAPRSEGHHVAVGLRYGLDEHSRFDGGVSAFAGETVCAGNCLARVLGELVEVYVHSFSF